MNNYQKLCIELNLKSYFDFEKLKLELVEFESSVSIEGHKKLIGKAIGDNSKIVFGIMRQDRSMLLQIIDLNTCILKNVVVVGRFALFTTESKFFVGENEYEVEETNYEYTLPVNIKIEKSNLSKDANALINEQIMFNFNQNINEFQKFVDDEVLNNEQNYFISLSSIMESEYKTISIIISTLLMKDYGIIPNIQNKLIVKLINKLIIKGKHSNRSGNKYIDELYYLPLEEIDNLYDKVVKQAKEKVTFDEFTDVEEEAFAQIKDL